MNNLENKSESIIIDNCVITKFSCGYGRVQGIKICKIALFEKISGSTASFINMSTGSRLHNNRIIADLSNGTISYDHVVSAWVLANARIGMANKCNDVFTSAIEAPSLPPSPFVVEPTHLYSSSSLHDIIETVNEVLHDKNIDIISFNPIKSKYKCEYKTGTDQSSCFNLKIFKDEGYHLIELQRRRGDRSSFSQAYDIIGNMLTHKNLINSLHPRSTQSFHQFKPRDILRQ